MACGACSQKRIKESFVHTLPDGTNKTYSSEVEAKAAVRRKGGSYKKQ